MGCLCPCLKYKAQVSDLGSSKIEEADSQCPQILNQINVVPPARKEVQDGDSRHQTEQEFQGLQPIQSPQQAQSNLDIAYSVSMDNNNSQSSSIAASHLINPNMVVIRHSEIRQSIVYRWQKPDFKVDELFLQIDYDKLFKP